MFKYEKVQSSLDPRSIHIEPLTLYNVVGVYETLVKRTVSAQFAELAIIGFIPWKSRFARELD